MSKDLNWQEWVSVLCQRVASTAFNQHMQTGGSVELYLTAYQRHGIYEDFAVAVDGAEGERFVVIGEPLPCHLTLFQLREWVRERLQREPILPLCLRGLPPVTLLVAVPA